MDKETMKRLTKDFPKSVVKDAPVGKFGSYVPHHLYTQRLVDVIPGGYDFTFEETRDKTGAIIGAKCKLYIKSTEQTIEEVGDVDNNALKRNITESEILKLAVSDGIKRCCMRLGVGLELWTGGVTEEEHYAGPKTSTPKPKLTEQKEDTKVLEKAKDDFVKDIETDMKYRLQKALEFHESNKVLRDKFKQEAWEEFTIDGPKDLQIWTDDHLDVFLDLFVAKQSETDNKDIKDLVDDVFPDSSIDKGCPKCGVAEWIEDNRAKKADAPEGSKLKNIPDFSCSQYMQNDGCGWGGYIGGKGDREAPSEWL